MTKDEITRALRICGNSRKCTECPLGDVEFCLHIMTTCAADLIEQQAARIAELEAKVPRGIPVTERLPKKGEDGRRDSDWVHCIVSVIWTYGSNFADAETHVFSAPALFDVDQKIWHVGSTDESRFSVNALIPLEDSDGGYFVTHWMPLPEAPKEGA